MKIICTACFWKGTDAELLKANHPFIAGEPIRGCPGCRDVFDLRPACDEPECWEMQTCGTPTPAGYRITCGRHRPEKQP